MKTVTMFQAEDGKLFNDIETCAIHDKQLIWRDNIASKLAKLPKGCDFANGYGYIQYQPSYINCVKLELLEAIKINTRSKSVIEAVESQKNNINTPTILGRYLDDNNSIFYSLYCRLFMNIDENGREFGQPYFANHPESAKLVKLFDFPF